MRIAIFIQDKITFKILSNHFHPVRIKSGSLKWCFGCLKSLKSLLDGRSNSWETTHRDKQWAVLSSLQSTEAHVCVCVCVVSTVWSRSSCGESVIYNTFNLKDSCANQYITSFTFGVNIQYRSKYSTVWKIKTLSRKKKYQFWFMGSHLAHNGGVASWCTLPQIRTGKIVLCNVYNTH